MLHSQITFFSRAVRAVGFSGVQLSWRAMSLNNATPISRMEQRNTTCCPKRLRRSRADSPSATRPAERRSAHHRGSEGQQVEKTERSNQHQKPMNEATPPRPSRPHIRRSTGAIQILMENCPSTMRQKACPQGRHAPGLLRSAAQGTAGDSWICMTMSSELLDRERRPGSGRSVCRRSFRWHGNSHGVRNSIAHVNRKPVSAGTALTLPRCHGSPRRASPSIAVIRSPVFRRPRPQGHPPARPQNRRHGGSQNSNPNPCNKAAGSVRCTRSCDWGH